MFFKLKGTSWHVSPFILLSVNFDHNNINNLFFSIWCGCLDEVIFFFSFRRNYKTKFRTKLNAKKTNLNIFYVLFIV